MVGYTSSFVVNYGQLVTNSSYLNPSNEGQTTLSIYAAKPVRFVARLVALYAISTVFAPLGACYNGAMALVDYPEGRRELFQKHSYAALNDAFFTSMTLSGLALSYFLSMPSIFFFAGLAFVAPALGPGMSCEELLGVLLPREHLRP